MFHTSLRDYDGMKFKDFVLYLGICIGPGASKAQWETAIAKYDDAISRILALNLRLFASVPMYNSIAFSILVRRGAAQSELCMKKHKLEGDSKNGFT